MGGTAITRAGALLDDHRERAAVAATQGRVIPAQHHRLRATELERAMALLVEWEREQADPPGIARRR